MKQKNISTILFSFFFLLLFAHVVFAITGSSSDGSVSVSDAGMSSTGVRSSSSDNTISSRTSSSTPGSSSSYNDATNTVTGNLGSDTSLSSTASSTTASSSSSETTADEGGNIPSSGGGGGGGRTASGSISDAASAETSETEITSADETSEQDMGESQTSSEQAVDSSQFQEPISILVELFEGDSLSLSPNTGVSEMTVLAITQTSATIFIDGSGSSNQLTGGVVINAHQETTLQLGESIDVDTNGDGIADLKITLSEIIYDEESQNYHAVFSTMYLQPTDETTNFIQKQVDTGEVALVSSSKENFQTEREAIIGVGLLILFSFFVIIFSLHKRKKKMKFFSLHKRK